MFTLLQGLTAQLLELLIRLLQAFLYVVCGVDRPVGSQGTAMEQLVEDVWPEGEVRLERHHVLTTDGFELVLHRLSSSGTVGEQDGVRSRLRPVLLMHGLFENSIVWVAGRKKSLAAHLVAEGRDVWLGNARGNALSSGPWGLWGRRARDWSFEDRARNDLPIMIEYVLNTTGADKLQYLGQSQGAALPVVGLSLCPVLCEKVADLVLLAPALWLKAPENETLKVVLSYLPMTVYRALYPFIALMHCIVPDAVLLPIAQVVMRKMGWLKHPYDPNSVKTLFNSVPSGGTSDANLAQLLKMLAEGNRMVTDISNVTCPVHCFLGAEDDVIDIEGTSALMKTLPDLQTLHVQPGYAHVDFVWTTDAPQTLYGLFLQKLAVRGHVRKLSADHLEETPTVDKTGQRKSFILGSCVVKFDAMARRRSLTDHTGRGRERSSGVFQQKLVSESCGVAFRRHSAPTNKVAD